MALTLHMHPLASYCWKVLIALHENETPFTVKIVNLGEPRAKAEFAALWPTAKIPLLEDPERERIVPETSIMIEYLDRHYPGRVALLPADAEARLEVRLWDRVFDAYVMTPMQQIVADRLRPQHERDPRGVAEAESTLRMAYDLIEQRLELQDWALGKDFSLADCAAAPSLFYASVVTPFARSHARLSAYLERLLKRPSVARTIDEARPYFQYFPFKDALPSRYLVA